MALRKGNFEYFTICPANDYVDTANFANHPLLMVHFGASRKAVTQLDMMVKLPAPQQLKARIIYVLAIDYL